MNSIIITGANRGLGLEFSRQYAEDGWRVFACCRDSQQDDPLHALAARHSNLSVHGLDVADHRQIDALAADMAHEKIDIVLNNAGVYGGQRANSFGDLDYAAWMDCFQVNTCAPARMAEAFVMQVGRSQKRLMVAITSLMGSIEDNGSGGSYLYRSSKAALNAVMKSLAIDLEPRGIGTLVLHPGWVRTDMGGPNGELAPRESVSGMRSVLENFHIRDSGKFLDYAGKELPW